jgi:hypothetical protein
MAKKARPQAATGAAALKSALPDDVKVISIPANANVTVEIDVNDMAIPYTIALDTDVVIKSLVDRREDLRSLTKGTHRLSWAFAHAVKDWKHTLKLNVNGAPEILEDKSEAQKHTDHSVGVAFLVVS